MFDKHVVIIHIAYTECPTTYQTRHFFNNSKTTEDIATRFEQEYVRCVRNEEECVCSAPSCCDTEQRSASQPACILPDAPLSGWGCLHNTVVVRECSVQCEFTQNSWKMYRYTVEERVFIVRTYWKTESIKLCQQQFLEKFGGWHPPSKYCIWALAKKLETKGTLLDELTGARPKTSEETIQNVKDRLHASPKKSLRRLSQESGLSRSTCQRAANKRSFMRTVSPRSTN